MRILQVTHQYPPHHVGGVELITQSLARHLAARDHEVHVLTRAPVEGASETCEDGVAVYRTPEARTRVGRFVATFANNDALRSAQAALERIRPDVVHIQHLMGWPVSLVDAIRALGMPYIVSLHDYWFVCANAQRITNDTQQLCDGPQGDNCGRCMLARAGLPPVFGAGAMPIAHRRNAALRDVLDGATRVISNSQFVTDWFRSQGFDVSGWRLMRYGLDRLATFRRLDRARPFRVSYIGGLAWQKGVHVLIEAFDALPQDAELCLAGEVNAFPGYVKQLKAASSHVGVRFLGKQTREQVWHLLGESDVVAVPSLWHETSSLITQEGLAAGCFVIASHVGAIGEVIDDPARGELVEPGDVAGWRDALRRAYVGRTARTVPSTVRSTGDYADDIAAIYADTLDIAGTAQRI